MQLKHLKTFISPQDGPFKVTAVAWAPNSAKLAVCTVDRVVQMFDENGEKRDKFATKPADSNLGSKSYQVTALAFSPDSTKLAVAQTDNIVFVYRVGEKWGEKKTICNKVVLQSAATCLVWPGQQPSFIFGQADGKVKMAGAKGSKSQTIYATESYVVSITTSPSGKGIISGHADGTIVRYFLEDEGAGLAKGPICRHPCPPYALAWGTSTFMAAGCDKRVIVYGNNGKVAQQFDYSRDDKEKEFTTAACSPSGQFVVLGSFDRLRVYSWMPKRELWEEAPSKEIVNLYTITALAWRRDGARLIVGSLCGAVEMYDCCLRRVLYKNKFEMTYVGLSQVIVKDISTGSRVVLKSHYGYEIDKVQIMGKDRYLVAHTSDTLLLGDMANCKLSEVAWHGTGGNEKFYFENQNVCMIFNAGELTLVEYGVNDIIGSVRTEFMNPHLISVRINERKQRGVDDSKKLAYLVDWHTICIMDLTKGVTTSSFSHEQKINWLELNETGRKLLFRDKKFRLLLYDVDTEVQTSLISYCSYVQWVPLSDVVVAQNTDNLCVWYNIDMPERVTMFPIKGEVVDLQRRDGHTDVLVKSGVDTISYTLDEGLIEFGTAMDDGDFIRALKFLETLEMTRETEAMWKSLGELTLEASQLHIAERCYAALGDVAKVRYLHDIIKMAADITKETGEDGSSHHTIKAQLAVLNKDLEKAEKILLQRGEVDKVISLYKELQRWDEAIAVAQSRGHPDLVVLQAAYSKWLLETSQEEKAGELKEKQGDLTGAVHLYMKAGLASRAAHLVMRHQTLTNQIDLLQQIATALVNGGQYEKAGDLFERARSHQQAMEAYKKGQAFRRAVELARVTFPTEVVGLEEMWGDYLCTQRQYDAAITHYVEAGRLKKAAEAAILARQWSKAVQIVEMQDPASCKDYFVQIATHFASVQDYEVAEQYFIKGDRPHDAVDMYIEAGKWEEAYKVASGCMPLAEVKELYVSRAKELEGQDKLREAERLYAVMGESDLAISMYKRHKQYDAMVRLVAAYHEDLLVDTHLHLAKELEAESQLKQAEYHYVQAGDWKAAVNMYREKNLWDDAYRVAKSQGGTNAANQVAYLWAKSLGGDSAVKLLTKFGLLEAAMAYATESFAFDFAFEIARVALKSKLPELHLKYALHLEDEGKYQEAEDQFAKAGKGKEAVLMYVHQQDWDNAQRVAELYSPESVSDVLVGQARAAFDGKNYQKAEAFLLRAERPDLAAKFYKDVDMWTDALRIVKDYIPQKLDEFQREMEAKSGKGYEDLLSQAKTWEQSGEFSRAVDCYLQLTTQNCGSEEVLVKVWAKAVELCIKFVPSRSVDTVALACDRLANLGKYIQAGDLYLSIDMVKEGLDMLMAGEAWDRAREIAQNIAPRYEKYVDEAYVDYLRSKNQPDQMQAVDPGGALKMYAESGNWEKCLQLAEKQGPDALAKYVAMYAASLIKSNAPLSALQLFAKYGAPPNPQNFNIYKCLCMETLGAPLESSGGFQAYAQLRNMLLALVEQLSKTNERGTSIHKEFEECLLISHYMAMRAACEGLSQAQDKIVAKLSVSLLRHTKIIPVDKAFYEAGIYCKAVGLDNMAFVFLNHFLDLCEAIEEGSLGNLDNSDFVDTDIPFEVPLPERQCVSEEKREEVKEWVLAVSMDQKVEQSLPTDERGIYVASLTSPHTKVTSPPCMITGYPVLRQRVEFKKGGRCANQEDWNKFITAMKVTPSSELSDVWKFLSQWCGIPNNLSYSFK
ncbi:hypothetical protein EMCRGX_G033922 [Ephydatia muelleri]